MDITTIHVEERKEIGSNAVRRLRAAGKVPAILYGEGKPTLPLAVSEHELERHLRQHHKVFKLRMGGRERHIYLQDVQFDCLTDRPLHVDFKRISMDERIHLKVELSFIGHPVGLSHGGRFVKDVIELAVASLPAAIPETVDVQVAELDVGDQILAKDLVLPQGVILDVPEDTVVCHVAEEVHRGPLPGAAGAEGEEAAVGAPAEGEDQAEGAKTDES